MKGRARQAGVRKVREKMTMSKERTTQVKTIGDLKEYINKLDPRREYLYSTGFSISDSILYKIDRIDDKDEPDIQEISDILNLSDQAVKELREKGGEEIKNILIQIDAAIKAWVQKVGARKAQILRPKLKTRKIVKMVVISAFLAAMALVAILLTILDVNKIGDGWVNKHGEDIGELIGCIDLVLGLCAYAFELLDDFKKKATLASLKPVEKYAKEGGYISSEEDKIEEWVCKETNIRIGGKKKTINIDEMDI